MAISLTPELEAILESKVQVGGDAPQGEIEIDWVLPASSGVGVYQDMALIAPTVTGQWFLETITDDGSQVFFPHSITDSSGDPISTGTVSDPNKVRDGNDGSLSAFPAKIVKRELAATVGTRYVFDLGQDAEVHQVRNLKSKTGLAGVAQNYQPDFVEYSTDGGSTWHAAAGAWSVATVAPRTWWQLDLTSPITAQHWRVGWKHAYNATTSGTVPFGINTYTIEINGYPVEDLPATIQTSVFRAARISIDRSRKAAAAQLSAEFANETGEKGYYSQGTPVFIPGNPCRAYIWHGDRANRVLRFTGYLEVDPEHRDPKGNSIQAKSRTRILLDPHLFTTTAPQDATEKGNDRTEANGVFLGQAPEYIAGAVLDLAGWPSADRDIATSGVTITEYRLGDGSALLDNIAGSGKLTDIAGWDFRDDAAGIAHLGPNTLMAGSEPDADWTFAPGANVMAYDHQADDQKRVTRVRVSGQMAKTIPKWAQTWETTLLKHPTGAWFVASAPTYLYVIDGVTQYLHKVRQSDRKSVAHWNLGPDLTYAPLGISADPTDPSIFLVLDADWRFGATTHAKVHKFDSSSKAHVSSTSLPDGEWSDMKFDGTHLWLTNFGDDRLYEKTYNAGGAAGATASFLYSGIDASFVNPSGLYLDGTTIGLFFNGGEAFQLIDTSAPGTITGKQSTKGTHISGGEIDTVTGTDLYAVAAAGDFGNTAGYVWKFSLAEDIEVDVVKWATDQDLEDQLGFQAGIEDRVHDLHPLDDPHPWIARIASIELQTVNSEAQAQAVADYQLVLRKRVRRVLDLTVPGHEGVEIDDAISYPDAVAGTDAIWMVDTLREDFGKTYTMQMSCLPWEAA